MRQNGKNTNKGPIYLLNVEEYRRQEEERANNDTPQRGRIEVGKEGGFVGLRVKTVQG